MSTPLHVPSKPPISSQFAQDEDMADLIPFFIDELGDRIEELKVAFAAGDLPAVQAAAHKVRGAAGGYGFPDLTDVAGQVEDSIRAGSGSPDIASDLGELVGLCIAAIEGRTDS